MRVLVVDDQPAFCHFVRRTLSKCNDFMIVAEDHDASSALVRVPKALPDLVLMDIEMPGMDGLEATFKIRRRFPSIRVIVMSVHEDAEYKRLAMEAGALCFIPKREFSLSRLKEALSGRGEFPNN